MKRSITVHAPVRVADVGGWTDTWFAVHGVVCNVAVGPGVLVSVRPSSGTESELELTDLGQRYRLNEVGFESLGTMHPMLRECLIAHHDFGEPIVVTISSAVPPGSSLGTSAAVGVALIAALTRFASSASDLSTVEPQLISRWAHTAETNAGMQSGVQDHAGAAFGGISRVDVNYPTFEVSPVDVAPSIREELGRRLFTVYLGKPHDSSEVHRMVISRLEQTGSGAIELEALRCLAERSIAALFAGDIDAYGATFDECVTAQRALHPLLINDDAELIIAIAARYSSNVKVNGAGGSGGSVTVLGPSDPKLLRDLKSVVAAIRGVTLLSLRLWPEGVAVIEGDIRGERSSLSFPVAPDGKFST